MLKTIENTVFENTGLTRWYSRIAPLTRPAIRIISQSVMDTEIAIGQSKFGGEPDLPKSYRWHYYKDRPVAFLAQFNMAEVSPYDQAGLLPKTGLLSFFYDPNQEPWGYDPQSARGWQVLYIPQGNELKRTAVPECDHCLFKPLLSPCSLAFSTEQSLPSWEAWKVLELGLSEDERNRYYELTNGGVIHRLLGHPATIQGDEMALQAQLVSNGVYMGGRVNHSDPKIQELVKGAGDWLLLLQLDTDPNTAFYWGMEGRLYFWIRRADLEARDFSRVWLIGQC